MRRADRWPWWLPRCFSIVRRWHSWKAPLEAERAAETIPFLLVKSSSAICRNMKKATRDKRMARNFTGRSNSAAQVLAQNLADGRLRQLGAEFDETRSLVVGEI